MTPAEFKTVEETKQNGRWDKVYSSHRGAVDVPKDLIEALKKNTSAHENFEPSHHPLALCIFTG